MTQRQKFQTDDVIIVYIINPVVMQICSILCFSFSILVKCCVHLQNSNASREEYIPQILSVLS